MKTEPVQPKSYSERSEGRGPVSIFAGADQSLKHLITVQQRRLYQKYGWPAEEEIKTALVEFKGKMAKGAES